MKYKTIDKYATGIYKEKGSKFLSFAMPAATPANALEEIDRLKKNHPKARHHCFAYLISWPNPSYRTYDDGEPSGTAGLPILNQIKSYGLTNVCIVVVRYFGGKLLGASGLANAYKQSARDALQNAIIIEEEVKKTYRLTFPYNRMGLVMDVLKMSNIEIVKKTFEERALVYFTLPLATHETQLQKLINQLSESHGGGLPQGILLELCETTAP